MTTLSIIVEKALKEVDLKPALQVFTESVVEDHMRVDIIRKRRLDPRAKSDLRIRIQERRLSEGVLGLSESVDVEEPLSITRTVFVPYASVNEARYPYIERALKDPKTIQLTIDAIRLDKKR